MIPDQIWYTLKDLALLRQVSIRTLRNKKHLLPKPDDTLKRHYWHVTTVEKWANTPFTQLEKEYRANGKV